MSPNTFFCVCNNLSRETPLLGGQNMASNINGKEPRICYTHQTLLISEIVHDFYPCVCSHERACMASELHKSVQSSFGTFIGSNKLGKISIAFTICADDGTSGSELLISSSALLQSSVHTIHANKYGQYRRKKWTLPNKQDRKETSVMCTQSMARHGLGLGLAHNK